MVRSRCAVADLKMGLPNTYLSLRNIGPAIVLSLVRSSSHEDTGCENEQLPGWWVGVA